ncbi:MAG: hypothetical protein K8I29_08630 [Alphaproteobacteria bacterium]|uniref:Uncharacterized protein n=1 Tax=Candidatus Nitrobium versatile TaxID=2884831 RepID=A0A953M1N1_9BACT|nr:hypothetical protein [Candidatus Nitrobium versatile]
MKIRVGWMALIALAVLVSAGGCGCGDDDDDDDGGGGPDSDADDDATDDDDAAPDDDDDDADDDGAYPENCTDWAPVFDFNLTSDPMVVPYPSDMYTVDDATTPSGRRVQVGDSTTRPLGILSKARAFDFAFDAINTLDGFSTQADIYIPLTAQPDAARFPDPEAPSMDDSVFVMVDDPDSPFDGEMAPVVVEWRTYSLWIRPFRPLREATRYVVAATRKIATADGKCYRATDSMRAVWEDAKSGKGSHPDLESALTRMETRGLASHRVLAISTFTTAHMTRDLDEARRVLDGMASNDPPEITDWSFRSDIDVIDYEDTLDRIAWGYLDVPTFRNADGLWERDANGDLVPTGTEEVLVHLTLPSADSGAGQPFPLSLYTHGIGDHKESLQAIASDWANAGFALIGLDAVCHGDRAPIPHDPATSLLCYFQFFDPLMFRDNLRETAVGNMWLARAVKALGEIDMIPPGGDGIPDFDVSRLYFNGISMGTFHAGAWIGLEENIDTWVFSSAGAKFIGAALEGPYLGELLTIAQWLDGLMDGWKLEDTLWGYGHLMQHALDAGDPANYLMHLDDPLPGLEGRELKILQQGSAYDDMIGGVCGGYFARSAGLPQLMPFVWDVGWVDHVQTPYTGNAFFQWDTKEHFLLWDRTPLGTKYRAQILHFMTTARNTGVGEVVDTQ